MHLCPAILGNILLQIDLFLAYILFFFAQSFYFDLQTAVRFLPVDSSLPPRASFQFLSSILFYAHQLTSELY